LKSRAGIPLRSCVHSQLVAEPWDTAGILSRECSSWCTWCTESTHPCYRKPPHHHHISSLDTVSPLAHNQHNGSPDLSFSSIDIPRCASHTHPLHPILPAHLYSTFCHPHFWQEHSCLFPLPYSSYNQPQHTTQEESSTATPRNSYTKRHRVY